MQYEPKTKEQMAHEQEERLKNLVWPDGVYDFRVISETSFGNRVVSTCDTTSSKGAEMIVLVLELMNAEGNRKVIVDYLVAAIPEKLYSVSVACGLNYKSGQLFASDFLGKSGKVQIKITKGTPDKRDSSKNYPDKNEVVTYIEGTAKFTYESQDEPVFDDEAPPY